MTLSDIIRMAQVSGIRDQDISPEDCVVTDYGDITDSLWSFAELVSAAEREACAKVCESEAAKWEGDGVTEPMGRLCAAVIRARGQQ